MALRALASRLLAIAPLQPLHEAAGNRATL
jgi:hypothetical protein